MIDEDLKNIKDNICPKCLGTGKEILSIPADQFGPAERVEFECCECDGTGTVVGIMCYRNQVLETKLKETVKEREHFKNWIRENSTCSSCGGDQGKTPGGCPCEECGLIGTQPWGG